MPRVPDILIHTGLSAAVQNLTTLEANTRLVHTTCGGVGASRARRQGLSFAERMRLMDQAEIKALQAEVPTLKKDYQLAVVISP